jgi:AraC family transcriptional activator of pobA
MTKLNQRITKLFAMTTASLYKTNSFEINSHVTKDARDKNNRFEIHTIEWMQSQQYVCNSVAEKINNFELLWLKNGKGSLQVDGQDHILTNSSMHCIFPGNIRKVNVEPGAEGYYISFTIEFLKLSEGYSNSSAWLEQYDSYTNVASTMIAKEMQVEFELIADKMKWEYTNVFNRRLELLKGLLNILMIYFSRNLNNAPKDITPNRENDLVNKFVGLMKKNFLSKKLVNDYAGLLCVTPNYLNRTVKKITGFTASHHIQQQIIIEAKRQAMYTTVSMKQIAYSLGFDNLAHFSKFFKNNCGSSFTEFKRQSLNPDQEISREL